MKKIILLLIVIIMLCGCNNRKCIKSHKEKGVRPQVVIMNGKPFTIILPYEFTICDEYDEKGSDKE